MLTLMFGCAVSKLGRSVFRSAICGLSTAAIVIVVEPALPPPPPAPEHAPATRANTTPTMPSPIGRLGDRRFVALIQSLPFLNQAADTFKSQRCQKTTLSYISQIGVDCNRRIGQC